VTRGKLKAALATFVIASVWATWASGSALAVSVAITGPKETVFDYTTMRCSDLDYPDGTVQPFRDSLGRLQLLTGTRRMIGTNFNDLVSDCARGTLVSSPLDPNPAHYNYLNWLGAIYTPNGRDVYGLVHSEWHGWEIPGACSTGLGTRRCGVVGITFAVSHDNGDTFAQPAPPDNFVATVPPRPVLDALRTGLVGVSTPIKAGSYYYAFGLTSAAANNERDGVCIMRSPDITDPTSWREWDGASFSLRPQNPFYENVGPYRTHICQPIAYDQIQSMARSVTYNTYLGKYVLTGTAVKYDPSRGQLVYGFYYSLSDDLIHWSMRQLLLEIPSLQSHQCGGPDAGSYPSLIDDDSTDRNFRTGDATMYLYYVEMHYNAACQLTLDRDVVRVPIQFSQ
jgi:hypothetical protein